MKSQGLWVGNDTAFTVQIPSTSASRSVFVQKLDILWTAVGDACNYAKDPDVFDARNIEQMRLF